MDKKLDTMLERISPQLNGVLNGVLNDGNALPVWMTYERAVLCLKDPSKGNAVDNYRLISCLPLMWKLMIEIIADELYAYFERKNILPEDQKGCRKGSRGKKDQL